MIELIGPLSLIVQWRLISSKFLSEGSPIILGPSVVTTKNLSVVHLPLCAHCMQTEPCCIMLEPLYAVSIVRSFFVEPGIGCLRSSTSSGNILQKVRRGSLLPTAPVSTFTFNVWVPGLSGSLICSFVKISVRLSLCCWTASNVHCSKSLYNYLGSLVPEFIAQIRLLRFLFWISCSFLGLYVVRAWANLLLFSFLWVHIFAQMILFSTNRTYGWAFSFLIAVCASTSFTVTLFYCVYVLTISFLNFGHLFHMVKGRFMRSTTIEVSALCLWRVKASVIQGVSYRW